MKQVLVSSKAPMRSMARKILKVTKLEELHKRVCVCVCVRERESGDENMRD